jgi:hypothetical protein
MFRRCIRGAKYRTWGRDLGLDSPLTWPPRIMCDTYSTSFPLLYIQCMHPQYAGFTAWLKRVGDKPCLFSMSRHAYTIIEPGISDMRRRAPKWSSGFACVESTCIRVQKKVFPRVGLFRLHESLLLCSLFCVSTLSEPIHDLAYTTLPAASRFFLLSLKHLTKSSVTHSFCTALTFSKQNKHSNVHLLHRCYP